MKYVAKSVKGQEFLYSTKAGDIFEAPDRSAQKMCDMMNEKKYALKDDNHVWHVHEGIGYPYSEMVMYKLFMYKGSLKAKRVR